MPWSTKPPSKKVVPAEDLPDFTQDFLELAKQLTAKTEVPTGWPIYRRGGSARHWTTAGANNYVPNGFTQIGVAEWNGLSATSGSVAVTLPRRYSGNPLVVATPLSTTPANTRIDLQASSSGETLTLSWWSTAGVTEVKIAWLAMGPGAAT